MPSRIALRTKLKTLEDQGGGEALISKTFTSISQTKDDEGKGGLSWGNQESKLPIQGRHINLTQINYRPLRRDIQHVI